jgi:hypothetical protein
MCYVFQNFKGGHGPISIHEAPPLLQHDKKKGIIKEVTMDHDHASYLLASLEAKERLCLWRGLAQFTSSTLDNCK